MASPLRQTLAQTKNNSKQKMVDLTTEDDPEQNWHITIHNHPLANKTRNKKKTEETTQFLYSSRKFNTIEKCRSQTVQPTPPSK